MVERVQPVALAALLAAVVGVAVNGSVPVFWLAFLLPLLAIATAAHLRTPRFVPLATLAIAIAPMPLAVPILLPAGGRSLFVLDILLPAAALWAVRTPSRSSRADRAVFAYAGVMLGLCLVGILAGADLSAVLQDFRGPLYLVCGYLIVSRRLSWSDRRTVYLTVGAILWWSVAAIVIALVTGQELLHGRVGETSAFAGGGTESLDAVRFLIASKELALVVLLGTVGALLLGVDLVRRRRVLVGLLVPAVVVVFMGFSRQSIIAVVVGVLYIVIVSPTRSRTLLRLGGGVAILATVLMVLGLAGVTARLTGDDTLVGRQVSAYSDRVISGLLGDNVTEDPGNQFRTMENEAALDHTARHPFVGAGLGRPYRGDLELEAFREGDIEYGRRYVHNVYLWYAAHGGIVGVAAIVVLLGRPIWRVLWPAFRTGSTRQAPTLAAGAPYVALLTIGLVEPVIHTNSTAPLMGAFLAFFALVESGRVGDGRATETGREAALGSP